MAQARFKIREELNQKLAEEQAKARQAYTEDSFVRFTVRYPLNWQVKHGDESIVFYSLDTTQQFTVEKTDLPLIAADSSTATSTWHGYEAYRGNVTRGGQELEVMLISLPRAHQWQKRQYIQLSGRKEYFVEILNSISDFEIKK